MYVGVKHQDPLKAKVPLLKIMQLLCCVGDKYLFEIGSHRNLYSHSSSIYETETTPCLPPSVVGGRPLDVDARSPILANTLKQL